MIKKISFALIGSYQGRVAFSCCENKFKYILSSPMKTVLKHSLFIINDIHLFILFVGLAGFLTPLFVNPISLWIYAFEELLKVFIHAHACAKNKQRNSWDSVPILISVLAGSGGAFAAVGMKFAAAVVFFLAFSCGGAKNVRQLWMDFRDTNTEQRALFLDIYYFLKTLIQWIGVELGLVGLFFGRIQHAIWLAAIGSGATMLQGFFEHGAMIKNALRENQLSASVGGPESVADNWRGEL